MAMTSVLWTHTFHAASFYRPIHQIHQIHQIRQELVDALPFPASLSLPKVAVTHSLPFIQMNEWIRPMNPTDGTDKSSKIHHINQSQYQLV